MLHYVNPNYDTLSALVWPWISWIRGVIYSDFADDTKL